jgi:hypothetical protein
VKSQAIKSRLSTNIHFGNQTGSRFVGRIQGWKTVSVDRINGFHLCSEILRRLENFRNRLTPVMISFFSDIKESLKRGEFADDGRSNDYSLFAK